MPRPASSRCVVTRCATRLMSIWSTSSYTEGKMVTDRTREKKPRIWDLGFGRGEPASGRGDRRRAAWAEATCSWICFTRAAGPSARRVRLQPQPWCWHSRGTRSRRRRRRWGRGGATHERGWQRRRALGQSPRVDGEDDGGGGRQGPAAEVRGKDRGLRPPTAGRRAGRERPWVS